MKPITRTALIFSIVLTATGAPGFAADKKAEPAGPSKEQRQKMAKMHEEMAECLESDRPMSECKSEMMKSCHEAMGAEGCPMMGQMGGGMHHGMMGGKEQGGKSNE